MMKKFCFIVLSLSFVATAVHSRLPEYDDDAEFDYCLRLSNDIDQCVQEETQRVLNSVKQNYRDILGNRKLLAWNGSMEANTSMLRDMYEGWTAYRNRLCSLSEAAAVNLEAIITTKYSCTLYHTLHHNAHLNGILELLNYKGAKHNQDFTLFKVYEHDKEYINCRQQEKKTKNECVNAELERSTQKVKNLYNTFLKDENVGNWNNGPDLKNGNYRDMFDSWIAYRNRICNLATWAYRNADIEPKVDVKECILFLTDEHAEVLGNILFAAHSSLDVGFEDGSDWETDGGLAEGKTVTPLKRRIENDTPLIDETKSAEKPTDTGRKTPAWAM